MMRLASFGKLKKLQTGRSMEQSKLGADQRQSPRAGRKLEKATTAEVMRSPTRGQNFMSRLASMGSLKSKRSSRSSDAATSASSPRAVIRATEVAELEMAFKVFDANGDGQICLAELGAVLRSLGGGDVTEEELQLIMHDVDKNRDGFISFEEFKDVHNEGGSAAGDPIREAFATFDKDGNNLICADELRAVLQSLGEKCHTLEDCRRMISCVDLDGDGFVNFTEFEYLLSAKS